MQSLVKWSSRLAGALLVQGNIAAISLKSRVKESEIEAWMDGVNFFFILAIGRSGSMFLAHLLNQAPGAHVCHEPVLADFAAYAEAFHNEEAAEDYLRRFRKKEIYLRVRDKEIGTYGEINTILRRHCGALKRDFSNATLLHLVRDGRDVVRSMMSRRSFKSWDLVTSLLHPQEGDPQNDAWLGMNRFEKLCWYWLVENRCLRSCIGQTVQLEKLLSDYDYFKDKLLNPLQLDISESKWLEATNIPKNVTRGYRIPHWSSWDVKMQRAFERICGEEMAKNGYSLNWRSETYSLGST